MVATDDFSTALSMNAQKQLELILVRHAKSDWSDPSLHDHDRPLNGRGRRNAPLMAQRLATTGVSVDRILSSTALRAKTTAGEFGEALGVPVELDRDLYDSSTTTLAAFAKRSGVRTVLIVAHDPGVTMLADRLSSGNIERMPTCAVARFTWSVSALAADTRDLWAGVNWFRADTWAVDTPR